MPSINESLQDDFTRQTVNLMRVEVGVRNKVLGIMKQLEIDIVNQIQDIDPTGVSAQSFKLNRLNALLKQTKDTIKTAYRKNRKTLTKDLTDIAAGENLITLNTLDSTLGVNITTVAFPRSLALSLARNTLIEGTIPSQWWSRQAASLQRSFSDQLNIGLLAGESNNELIQRIRGTSTGKRDTFIIDGKKKILTQFSGGVMDVGTNQATALVRTSVQSAAQDARMQTFKENGHIIKGVSASVTFDLRTSDLCMGRSGFAWDLKTGEPINNITNISFPGATPWHWNCRTQLTAVTKSWKELSNRNKSRLGRSPKNLKESMDGQVSADQTYTQWLKKQSKKKQIEALGKTKQQLFKNGKLDLRELNDQSGRPLTIDELTKNL